MGKVLDPCISSKIVFSLYRFKGDNARQNVFVAGCRR
jgi:hypothetical protein